ncbi:uncharacterized protein F4812DRAFT_273783 [Daldinia caldariorum]|uniref:uncharacterized protein n=1 Tax=Daldinia caldariorum TaxID=326644 RepID=UPI00200853D6|nr:uncharacterized protein F4812DRAFT_273783 [Daldinia caldariorum]KAI1470647.1 hypothetical protein F4812DRAFT_273783 [Daldinia caldariorum]
MLLKAEADGGYKNIQVYQFPECALFHQALDEDGNHHDNHPHVVVTYHVPTEPLIVPPPPQQFTALRVPLAPPVDGLETVDIKLFGTGAAAFRMGDPYDAWFSACLGYPAVLVYIGDNRRPVLAHAPARTESRTQMQTQTQTQSQSQSQSLISYLASYVPYHGRQQQQQQQPKESRSGDGNGGLAFNEAAPFLVTSKASLRDVSARLPEGQEMDMIKFRPNIVVDEVWVEDSSSPSPSSSPFSSGPEEEDENDNSNSNNSNSSSADDGSSSSSIPKAWDEDFWAELRVSGRRSGAAGLGRAGRRAEEADAGPPRGRGQPVVAYLRAVRLSATVG